MAKEDEHNLLMEWIFFVCVKFTGEAVRGRLCAGKRIFHSYLSMCREYMEKRC